MIASLPKFRNVTKLIINSSHWYRPYSPYIALQYGPMRIVPQVCQKLLQSALVFCASHLKLSLPWNCFPGVRWPATKVKPSNLELFVWLDCNIPIGVIDSEGGGTEQSKRIDDCREMVEEGGLEGLLRSHTDVQSLTVEFEACLGKHSPGGFEQIFPEDLTLQKLERLCLRRFSFDPDALIRFLEKHKGITLEMSEMFMQDSTMQWSGFLSRLRDMRREGRGPNDFRLGGYLDLYGKFELAQCTVAHTPREYDYDGRTDYAQKYVTGKVDKLPPIINDLWLVHE